MVEEDQLHEPQSFIGRPTAMEGRSSASRKFGGAPADIVGLCSTVHVFVSPCCSVVRPLALLGIGSNPTGKEDEMLCFHRRWSVPTLVLAFKERPKVGRDERRSWLRASNWSAKP